MLPSPHVLVWKPFFTTACGVGGTGTKASTGAAGAAMALAKLRSSDPAVQEHSSNARAHCLLTPEVGLFASPDLSRWLTRRGALLQERPALPLKGSQERRLSTSKTGGRTLS